jgi:hypothetical protein
VILDLYEVRSVTEGFGEDAQEKDYHEGGTRYGTAPGGGKMAVKGPRA